jgi:Na+/proline symporter
MGSRGQRAVSLLAVFFMNMNTCSSSNFSTSSFIVKAFMNKGFEHAKQF